MFRSGRSRPAPFAALVLLSAALLGTPQAGAQPTPAFIVNQTVLDVGRTQVIAFRIDGAAADATLDARVSDPTVLEIVRPPEALAGQTIGYLRVRPLKTGACDLTIGASTLAVTVVEERTVAGRERPGPRIVGPATGAAVWGKVAVGVQSLDLPNTARPPVEVRLSNGSTLSPVSETSERQGPTRHVLFEFDADALPPGPLTIIATDGAGASSDPVTVRIVRPADKDLTAGEAETDYKVTRPRRFADGRRSVGRDPSASGGAFYSNSSGNPALCFPVKVDQAGYYQVVATAAGSFAGGAFPTIAVVVDGAEQPSTNGRTFADHWHRVVLGVPILLQPGERIITPYFANDFYAPGLADRNLRLDRIEVLRIAPAEAPAIARLDGDDAPAMMGAEMGGAMNGAMSGPMMEAGGDRRFDAAYSPVRIAFNRVLNGLPVAGGVEIDGTCWWPDAERTPPPTVTLLVNDRPQPTQRSAAPRFWIDPRLLRPGPNQVRLVATTNAGSTATTPAQTIYWDYPFDITAPDQPRDFRRFSIYDQGWDPTVRARLTTAKGPSERRCAAFSSNGEAVLTLPDDLSGRYEIILESLGENFDGPAIAEVSLRIGDQGRRTPGPHLVDAPPRRDRRPARRPQEPRRRLHQRQVRAGQGRPQHVAPGRHAPRAARRR